MLLNYYVLIWIHLLVLIITITLLGIPIQHQYLLVVSSECVPYERSLCYPVVNGNSIMSQYLNLSPGPLIYPVINELLASFQSVVLTSAKFMLCARE